MSKHRPEKILAWKATIDDWKRSGQTVNAFCRSRQLTRSNFDRWRRILATRPGESAPTPPPAFVHVRVVAEPMAEVVLRSGVVVRVPLGAAADWSPLSERRHAKSAARRSHPGRRRAGRRSQGDRLPRRCRPLGPERRSGICGGLLAHVIVSKFIDHLPLHRQEGILARHGWDVRRSTLCDHLRACGELLTPLYDLMRQRLLRSFTIHADDTPLVLLRPRRAACAWVYLGDEASPYTLFDLTAGRRQEFPQRFLAGYRGFVHADVYDGYNAVHDNVRNLGCWMHARRYFVETQTCDPRAVEALAFIRTLYAVEREIQVEREKPDGTFTDADVVRVRRTRAGPILAAFADWLEVQHRATTPKSLFGQAVGYAVNQWASLVRYLDDGRFAIDNGAAERAIRPLAIGRGNWLHVGGDGGLKAASVLLSVCASATRHNLGPWPYLRDVFDQLAVRTAATDLADLLPDAPTRNRLAA